MPNISTGRKRNLSLMEKVRVVAMLETDAVDGIIEVVSIVSYATKIAHMLGKDSGDVSLSSVQTIAREAGITFKSQALGGAVPVPVLMARMNQLEEALTDVIARVTELERVYIEDSNTVLVPEKAVTRVK